jgi:hypothetical protein
VIVAASQAKPSEIKQRTLKVPRGSRLVLQIRAKVLNDDLESTLEQCHPSLRRTCCITPDFLADSRLPVQFAPAESP